MKQKDMLALMVDEGYLAEYPSVKAATIDASVCRESNCENCGHEGLAYKPFIKHVGGYSYRAFAVCPECKETFEF